MTVASDLRVDVVDSVRVIVLPSSAITSNSLSSVHLECRDPPIEGVRYRLLSKLGPDG